MAQALRKLQGIFYMYFINYCDPMMQTLSDTATVHVQDDQVINFNLQFGTFLFLVEVP